MKKAFKRIWPYLKKKRKLFIINMLLLLTSQLIGFATPLIIKNVLDDCIAGIKNPWYEVNYVNDNTVYYNGKNYSQELFIDNDNLKGKEVTILIEGKYFYFLDDIVDSKYKILNDRELELLDSNTIIPIVRLESKDIMNFYNPIMPIFYKNIITFISISIISIIAAYFYKLTTDYLTFTMVNEVRKEAINTLENKPIDYFDSEHAGTISSKVIVDSDGVMRFYNFLTNSFLNSAIQATLAIIGMCILDYRLVLIAIAISPIIILWMLIIKKLTRNLIKKINEIIATLSGKLNEVISGILILKLFNYKKEIINEYKNLNDVSVKLNLRVKKIDLLIGSNIVQLIKGLLPVVVIAYFYLTSNLTGVFASAGLMYAYYEYFYKFGDPISNVVNDLVPFQTSVSNMNRIFNLIEGKTEDDSYIEIPRFKGNIAFKNVSFSYLENTPVLNDISFNIKAGQTIGIVGHTGSGKTTLMNLLVRYNDLKGIDNGNIYIDNVNITDYSKRSYRSHVGIILQDPVLFKGTIASNIRFGKENVSDEEILDILNKIGGDRIISKFPKGINQEITRAGLNLSAGEKQIISFARAFIYNPSILIMDEATSHIDTETENALQTALKTLSKDRTLIIIAHRLSTIKDADNILVMESGKLIEEGNHRELYEQKGYYFELCSNQRSL